MTERASFIDKISWAGLCNRATYDNTWDITYDVILRAVPGDLVECGVFAGAQPAIMAKVCQVLEKFYSEDES
jgi:hypothetical protein